MRRRRRSGPGSPLPAILCLALAACRSAPVVAVAYQDLGSGATELVAADEVFHAASTMKLAVLIELFRRADQGLLDLDAPLPVRNAFRSVADGSQFGLDPADDSDPELYAREGQEVALRELARRMIVKSSNLATNLLLELLQPAQVQRTIEALGTTRMQVRRGVEDGKAFRQGIVNTTTARDLLLLLRAIARGEAASAAACAAMVEILSGQEHRDLIPAGLPAGVKVAHKTGQITAVLHDAAIVYPAQGAPFVLVVLTRGFAEPGDAARAIAATARRAWASRRAAG